MIIQITQSGSLHRLDVERIQFVVHCHYVKCNRDPDGIGEGWFLTSDHRQLYCRPDHKNNRYALHRPSVTSEALRQSFR